VKNEASKPMIRVVANPRIGPVPKLNNMNAVMIDVRLESKIAENACLYPSARAFFTSFPLRNSSFVLSYISTLASTAIPSESTIPAIPDIVSAAWKDVRTPKVKKKFSNNAQFATIPGIIP